MRADGRRKRADMTGTVTTAPLLGGMFFRKRQTMRRRQAYLSVIPFLFCQAVLGERTAQADIYLYRDQNGHAVISDSPPENAAQGMKLEIIKDRTPSRRSAGPIAIEADPAEKYPSTSDAGKTPSNAAAAKTPAREGPGFFVNEKGYIMTSEHLLRLNETGMQKTDKPVERADQEIRSNAVQPPMITEAGRAAFTYSDEVIRVPADIRGR